MIPTDYKKSTTTNPKIKKLDKLKYLNRPKGLFTDSAVCQVSHRVALSFYLYMYLLPNSRSNQNKNQI